MTVPAWEIREGDVLDRLREMPDESVHCVVTSPPYWGLRDYGTAAWDGGDPDCGHKAPPTHGAIATSTLGRIEGYRDHVPGDNSAFVSNEPSYRAVCGRCGARRVDQQLGLEATPAEYLARMVAVFREVRRVLRSDGTCFVNMGDSYAGDKVGNTNGGTASGLKRDGRTEESRQRANETLADHMAPMAFTKATPAGLKPKDLIGMPWRLAFALQADGWWLRSEIIWAKPNPMPESVTDRPTKAHEQIFLLTKAARYYYDAEAVREPMAEASAARYEYAFGGAKAEALVEANKTGIGVRTRTVGMREATAGRNARSVWTIATQPYAEAHFATFPEELPRRCILAGTSERGVCPACGAPWRRTTEATPEYAALKTQVSGYRSNSLESLGRKVKNNSAVKGSDYTTTGWEPTCAHGGELAPKAGATPRHDGSRWNENDGRGFVPAPAKTTTGWDPACAHAHDPVPAVVLDPFAGSGTTLMVAVRHGRSAIGIELNPEYAAMARRRILADHGAVEPTNGHTPAEVRGVQGRLGL